MAIKLGNKVEILGGRYTDHSGVVVAFNGVKQCTVKIDANRSEGMDTDDKITKQEIRCRVSLKNVKVVLPQKSGKKRKSTRNNDSNNAEEMISKVTSIIQERRRKRGRRQYLCRFFDGSAPTWIERTSLKGTNVMREWEALEEGSNGEDKVDEVPETFENDSVVEEKSNQLAQWLENAKRPVFLLGAGVSSPVLPTFRGKNGLWTKNAHKNTKSTDCVQAQPTYTHRALTALEKAGYVYFCVTQNYDDLSRRSGFPSQKLSELHGNILVEACDNCGMEYHRGFEVVLDDSIDHETGRTCERKGCTGTLRDNIVHFDEALPWHELKMANAKFTGSDLAIVLGSSLHVEPAASMPFKSKRRHVNRQRNHDSQTMPRPKSVIVNVQPTPNDNEADLIIRAKTDDVFRHITAALGVGVM